MDQYSLCLVPCGGRKRLPVLHHRADYKFISFGITEPIFVTRGRMQPRKLSLLHVERLNKTKSLIFLLMYMFPKATF